VQSTAAESRSVEVAAGTADASCLRQPDVQLTLDRPHLVEWWGSEAGRDLVPVS
jgi:hypothetical protein